MNIKGNKKPQAAFLLKVINLKESILLNLAMLIY